MARSRLHRRGRPWLLLGGQGDLVAQEDQGLQEVPLVQFLQIFHEFLAVPLVLEVLDCLLFQMDPLVQEVLFGHLVQKFLVLPDLQLNLVVQGDLVNR